MFMPDCWKRNSKLESYLKRSLQRHVFEDIRYYESCVVKFPNESLTFQYVILTGKSVLLATYPFRSVKEAIRLHDVVTIKMELDIPAFLKGNEGHNCQHIRISYKKNFSESQSPNLKILKEEQEELEDLDVCGNSSASSSTFSMDTEVCCGENTQSLSNVDSHDTDTITSLSTDWKVHSEPYKCESSYAEYGKKQKSIFLIKENESTIGRSSIEPQCLSGFFPCDDTDFLTNYNMAKGNMRAQRNPTIISQKNSSISDVDSAATQHSLTHSRTSTPEPKDRSISSLLHRVQYNQPRASRSFSSMAHYSKSLLPVISSEKRSQSVLERPRRSTNVKSFETNVIDSFHPYDELHIYVMQAKPILFNNLQSSWCTYLLNKTQEISKPSFPLNETSDSSQVENLYNKIKTEIINAEDSIENAYSLLNELLTGFQLRSQLKFIFWKDQMLYHHMVQKLEQYLHNSPTKYNSQLCCGEIDIDSCIQERQDELELSIILLDILFDAFHDTDHIHEKLKMLQFHNGSLIKQLLSVLVHVPYIPSKFQNTSCRMLEDYNQFSSCSWKNLPEGELIDLMGTVTNKIGGILSELMATIKKLSENNSSISITILLKDIILENYLKRSITQSLGILFSAKKICLQPEDCIIVYHHFFVLKCLMDNLSQVQDYIKEFYQEEFRYYIIWSRISSKIPEKYPVKRILRPLVDYIHDYGSREKTDITLHRRIS